MFAATGRRDCKKPLEAEGQPASAMSALAVCYVFFGIGEAKYVAVGPAKVSGIASSEAYQSGAAMPNDLYDQLLASSARPQVLLNANVVERRPALTENAATTAREDWGSGATMLSHVTHQRSRSWGGARLTGALPVFKAAMRPAFIGNHGNRGHSREGDPACSGVGFEPDERVRAEKLFNMNGPVPVLS